MAIHCSRAVVFAAVILAAGTHAPNQALAQNVNDFMRTFGGIMQQAMEDIGSNNITASDAPKAESTVPFHWWGENLSTAPGPATGVQETASTDTALSPQFKDFAVSTIYSGASSRPNLSTPQAREFRTRIIEASSGKVNFAGHYIVARWGCGTDCVAGAVIDALTGQVTFFPFVYVCCWQDVKSDFEPIRHRPNSRLIVFSGQLHEEGEMGTHYFVIDNGQFKFLKTNPLGGGDFEVPR